MPRQGVRLVPMPTSADEPDRDQPDRSADGPEATQARGPGVAKALTEAERKELLAENRRARADARRREAAKRPADDSGDPASADTGARNAESDDEAADQAAQGEAAQGDVAQGDAAQGDTGAAVDPSRVPGVVTAARPRRPGRGLLIGLCSLIAVLVVGLGVLGYLYAQSGDGGLGPDSGVGQEAMADAKQYATDMLTYQPGGYADLDQRIRAISTPDFADRYIEASPEARRGNDEAEVTSVGTAVDAGLTSISDDRAVVLVAVDHTLSSPELPSAGADGVTYQRRVQVTLTRDGDRWLVSDFITI